MVSAPPTPSVSEPAFSQDWPSLLTSKLARVPKFLPQSIQTPPSGISLARSTSMWQGGGVALLHKVPVLPSKRLNVSISS